jgi:hypothetical protein
MGTQKKRVRRDAPATYRIRIQGYLDESWSGQLGGMTINTEQSGDEAPVTTLEGELVDQAALAGVLGTVYELGCPLLSVEHLAHD